MEEKARILQRDLIEKHLVDGLYVSIVPAGAPAAYTVDVSGSVIHAGVWTGRYLAGVAYQYAVTKDPAVRKHGRDLLMGPSPVAGSNRQINRQSEKRANRAIRARSSGPYSISSRAHSEPTISRCRRATEYRSGRCSTRCRPRSGSHPLCLYRSSSAATGC